MGQNFSCNEQSWSRTWSTKSTTTTSRRPLRRKEAFSLKTDVFAFASRSKAKAKQEDLPLLTHLQELYLCVKEYGLMILNEELNPIKRSQWQTDWTLFFGMDNYLEKMEFWRLKDDLRNQLEHSQYWSHEMWKSKMAGGGGNKKRFQYCTDFVRTRNSLSPSSSRSFRTQSHWSFITGQCTTSERFLWAHSSHRMCDQFTLHHKYRIDTGRTKFKQGKTDSILYACESHGQGTQRSVQAWLDQTTSCTVQAENVEKTPRYGVLGRYTACST